MAPTISRAFPFVDPFEEVSRAFANMGKMFSSHSKGGTIATDMIKTDKGVVVMADVPGVRKEDISIEVRGYTMTISGEFKKNEKYDNENFLVRERYYGPFTKSIAMPEEISPDKINARFENGILCIDVVLDKEAKKIDIG
jgi:HSP20 family protein